MTGDLFETSLPEFAKRAKLEACRLIGLGHFRPDDRADLEQEFLLQLWRKRERPDLAHKGSSAYVAVVMRNRGRDLLRYEYGPVRDRHRQEPLPGDFDADERRALPPALTSRPALDEQIDIRRAVERLPAEQRRFTALLGEYGILEAARQMRISRSTAWRWRIEIQKHFLRYGVGQRGLGEALPRHLRTRRNKDSLS